MSLRSRFDAKVVKNETGCWGWTGATYNGRPYLFMDGRSRLAYRAAWTLENGAIPPGKYICHTCDNGLCCRPDHLFLGTAKENNADARSKGRSAFGTRTGNAVLDPDKVRQIRELRDRGWSQQKIANLLGVARMTVSFAARGITWREVQ